MKPGPKPALGRRTTPLPPPDTLSIAPDAPEWMSEQVAVEWWKTCQLLIDRDQLTRGDLLTVENLIRLRELLPKITSTGELNTTINTITKLCRELGLTPSSRHKVAAVTITEEEEEDDLAAFKREIAN